MMAGETVDNIEELNTVLYDGTRMSVGATSDQDLERIVREGGRKGEIYGQLKAFRDKYADRIRQEFPMIPRRVSGFNLPALLPLRAPAGARADANGPVHDACWAKRNKDASRRRQEVVALRRCEL